MGRVLDLTQLRQENRTNGIAIEALLRSLSDEGLNFRPGPGRWSIAHCLQHLNVSLELYLPRVRRVIDEGRRRGLAGEGASTAGMIGGLFISRLEPPPKLRVRAPRLFHPRDATAATIGALLPECLEWRDRLDREMAAAGGLDLGRLKLGSPASGLLRLSLAEAFAVLTAHDRRHLWQAREVMRAPAFPR